MTNTVKARAALFALVGALSAAVPAPAFAHPQTQAGIEQRIAELRRLRQELDAREQAVRAGIPGVARRRDALTHELEELEAITAEVQGRVNEAAGVLGGIQSRLDAKNTELRKAEKAIEARVDGIRDRAVQVYKHGPASLIDMVVGSEGFGEFLRRFAYMVHVVRTDNEKVAEIKRMRANIVRQRDAIAELRDRASRQMAVVVHERDHAAAIQRSVADERHAVVGELRGKYAQIGDIQAEKERYEQETAELQAESIRISGFLKGYADGNATVSPRGMVWPASGRLTSTYGWRTHPIFKTRRFHAGIDIGAPSGTAVVAAATGKVVYAGTATGYGKHVIVSHGGGLATLYGHLSSISSGVGAVLARGDSVGRVGCTGYCTGPHLHFEVRMNGEPDNPLRWLP
ncbi:MAG TPA: peptidoglycan DD-metalloendopeptidase family protein [Actinomycetota bacterium]|nr:peptidoglycan DD-metalloendopeptidase family protein [Actinomycetota bacterium]